MATYTFPPSFIFGIADADLQVVGETYPRTIEKSQQTMWDTFTATSGKCYHNTRPGVGVDRYHRWREDVALMQSLGVKHYRTSISMSRMLKENGQVNAKAVKWYRTYLKSLKKAGITIYATLYHWELPQYLSAIGGWTNRKSVDVFTQHAAAVANNLGEYIDEYFILNEPWCASMLSYHLGIHAPGEQNLCRALLAAHNLLLSQGSAYEALRQIDTQAKISTVVNVETSYANSLDPKDIDAARKADGYFNRWFLDPLFLGKYPKDMVDLYGKDMPKVTSADMKTIAIGSKLFTLGVNYYCGRLNRADSKSLLGYSAKNTSGAPTNDLGWPIFVPPYYPEGLYDILQQVYFSYRSSGLKRLYITENGMALESKRSGNEKVINDAPRIAYFRQHLAQVYKAIQRGIPVLGYFAWTLMDNFEWAEGYRPKSAFGMVYVDRKTMKRTPKQSALWYAKVMKTNCMSALKDITQKEYL